MERRTVPVVVHERTVETRTTPTPVPIDPHCTVTQWRIVCTCGHRTHWNRDWRRTRREADRHTLDGQLSVSW